MGVLNLAQLALCLLRNPRRIRHLREPTMPFTIRPYRRMPVCCPVTYHTGDFEGQGRVWSLSLNGLRLSGDFPMQPGETLSLTVTQPNEQRIAIPEAMVRWSRGKDFAMENSLVEPHTHTRSSIM